MEHDEQQHVPPDNLQLVRLLAGLRLVRIRQRLVELERKLLTPLNRQLFTLTITSGLLIIDELLLPSSHVMTLV